MTTEEYIALVTKNLEGEISPNQFKLLNKVTADNSELAIIRLELEDAWDAAGDDQILVKPKDTADLLSRIKASKNSVDTQVSQQKSTSTSKAKVFSIGRVMSAVAASLVFVVVALWLTRAQDIIYDQAGEYVLEDNTKVILRNGGNLTVSPFNDSQRKVTLIGEAFFEVTKDALRPFEVHAKNVKVEVLGTSFLVKEQASNTYIDVVEGSVRTIDTRSLKTEVLSAGMLAHHSDDGTIATTTDASNLSAWRAGYYRFSNVSLGDALEELSLIFNTKITVEDTSLMDCDFSGNLAGDAIIDLLDRIAAIHKMEVRQDGSKWILIGGSCN